jgi:hypothetical protein
MTIEAALRDGRINKHEVSFEGEAFGIPAGRYGDHLAVGLRISGSGVCNSLYIAVTKELQNQVTFRRLMVTTGARRAMDDGSLIRWVLGFSASKDQQHLRDAWAAQVASTLPPVLEWARQWDSRNTNKDIAPALQPGIYGVFEVTFDLETGAYQVRCPKGKHTPLKSLDATFDYDTLLWTIPDEQEAGLASLAQKQIKAKAKAQKLDAKAPVEGYGDIKITSTDRGYEVIFPKDRDMSERLHDAVPGAKWDRTTTTYVVSHRSRNALLSWIGSERVRSEKLEAERQAQEAERQAQEGAWKEAIRANPIQSTPHVKVTWRTNGLWLEFDYDPSAVATVKAIPGAQFWKNGSDKAWIIPNASHLALRDALPRIESMIEKAEQELIDLRRREREREEEKRREQDAKERAAGIVRFTRVSPHRDGWGNGETVWMNNRPYEIIETRRERLDDESSSMGWPPGCEGEWGFYLAAKPLDQDQAAPMIAERDEENRREEARKWLRSLFRRPEDPTSHGLKAEEIRAMLGDIRPEPIGAESQINMDDIAIDPATNRIWLFSYNGRDGDDWSRNNWPGCEASFITVDPDEIHKAQELMALVRGTTSDRDLAVLSDIYAEESAREYD